MEGKKNINSHANTPQKTEVGDDGRHPATNTSRWRRDA